MAYVNPELDLKNASTGDPSPENREKNPPANPFEAIDRRAVRQAIMTHLLSEVADEILASKATITKIEKGTVTKGDLRARYDKGEFRKLHELIEDPEGSFNKVRDKLLVGQPFGSINLVVFRNAMAIGEKDVDPEEVAKRVVIRAGLSGGYRDRNFAGCK